MFVKIYNFICEYEDLIKFCLLIFGVMCLSFYIAGIFDKNLTREKNIIENTKEYFVYDNCRNIDNKFYCWNY